MKLAIHTPSAPEAIGPYSQAIKVDKTVYLSGQIPLNPTTMTLVAGDISRQAQQVFQNLEAVCLAAGGSLNHIVRLTIYLMDFGDFAAVNDVMKTFFQEPYPARSTIQVAGLPKEARIEIDAIMAL